MNAPAAPPQSRQQLTIQAASFQGPVPPPAMLAQYEQICPGFSERTLTLVEQQAANRRSIEQTVIKAKVSHEAMGQWMAFTIALAFLGLAGYAMSLHQIGVGASIFGVDVVGLSGMFIYRQRREEKRSAQGIPQIGSPT